jgi:hypothetical protein
MKQSRQNEGPYLDLRGIFPVRVQGANSGGRLSPAADRVNPTSSGSCLDSKTSMRIAKAYRRCACRANPRGSTWFSITRQRRRQQKGRVSPASMQFVCLEEG